MRVVYEDVRLASNHSFHCGDYTGKRFDCPYHRHPEFELTLVASGHGYRLTGDRMENFAPGDLVLHGSNLPHLYQSWAGETGPVRSLYIQFDPERTGWYGLPECRSLRRMLQRAERGLHFPRKWGAVAQRRMERLMELEGPLRVAEFLSLIGELATSRRARPLASLGFQSSANSGTTERLRRVLAYIENHYAESIDLKQVAAVASLHPQSFSRFFSREMGKPFQSYLVELRLSHASRALLDEDKPITEIAYEVGFSNLSNFNRLFKRFHGENPTAYRRRLSV